MTIAILGSGAFGTALAVALAQNGPVTLWARDAAQAAAIARRRENTARLPGVHLPENVSVTAEITQASTAEVILLAMPMQRMAGFLGSHAPLLQGKTIVACSKGIDLVTGQGPTALIRHACPDARAAILTGPSFAADIARGLPTALTLACRDDAADLQAQLATPSLRLYRSADTIGAELGGALKNVVAIAAGVVIGAGLGDSARAALMTRGFAEMNRLATALGARAETLAGLSGLGDLVLTCTSMQSRNFRYGHALGAGEAFDTATTVEGAATSKAVTALAADLGVDMPIAAMVAALVDHRITVEKATQALLSRPLKEE
ncbi:NAD(P)H-dependent glycerol-3-phosphate dehydrogenase [Pontitalea aquivivens]|uniref:NAD(P)H-dependent glycerol-3-phosphate dehydrogenase n=1 Tax=Pontitalea aquivivens TaxID=3388663 RepID=UPI003970A60B